MRPVYAPALVAFVGTPDLGVSLAAGGSVAWFPLGPGEVYRPAYAASRDYFTRVNVTNTTISVTHVTNVYNNPRTEIRHVNVERPNAVTAVPTQAFVEARSVQRATVRIDPQVVQRAPVVAAPTQVVPQRASIVATTAPAQARPAPTVVQRAVIAKWSPPPIPPPIEQREQLVKREGKPLDQAELQKLAPAGNAARANVRVAQPSAPPKPLPALAPSAADKERAPQNAQAQESPGKEPAPQNAQGRTNARPGQEAVTRAAPPASSAPPVAADTSKGPRAEERAKGATRPEVEVESKPSEPPQRTAAPRAPVERATPPPNQRTPEPASRPEVANAPPRATSARARQPESAKAPPASSPEVANAPQREPARGPSAQARPPESVPPAAPPGRQAMTPPPQARQQPNAVRRPEPPEPPPAPAARQAPPQPQATMRAAPPEPPRQQAAMQPPRPSETRPQPSAPPRAAEAPPQRNAQGKAKGNEMDKDKGEK